MIVQVIHSRKGVFKGRVTRDTEEWLDIEIIEGSARYLASEDAVPGDTVTIRKSLCTITELDNEEA